MGKYNKEEKIMIEIFKTDDKTRRLEQTEKIEKGVWINMCAPTEEEIEYIISKTGADKSFIEDALDKQERSHIDTGDDQVFISVNVPVSEKSTKYSHYNTMPLGMIIIKDDYIITIATEELEVLRNIRSERLILGEFVTYKKSRMIFQVLYKVAEEYIIYIDRINSDIEKFEHKLERNMENKELLKLIYFQKSMVYFDAALKSNQTVIERLRRGKIIKLYEEDEEILEDSAIENRQAMEMVTTYSAILNGMIEVFGTMVSNNLNIIMKFLTSITILISIPTLIASILGMNVTFPFATTVIGFWGVMVVSAIVTVLVWKFLKNRDMM